MPTEAATARAAAPGEKRSGHHLHSAQSHRHGQTLSTRVLPSGNPIEHRLFSQIAKNWAGEPLTDLDKILHFIRTTQTESGLTARAYLIPDHYDTGVKLSDAEMRRLNLVPQEIPGRWKYTPYAPLRM